MLTDDDDDFLKQASIIEITNVLSIKFEFI